MVRRVFERVLAEEPSATARILAEECAGDSSLLHEVESLLSAHEEATGLLTGTNGDRSYPEPLIGRTAGPYQIHSTLGMGGMGIVYRAFDNHLDRYVALKVLPPEGMTDAAREAFVREAKGASALNHPNIVTIYDTGSADGIHYIAMELVDGQTLAQLIRGRKPSVREAVGYAIQIAGALASAHAAGLVHRDIKPGNIMVTPPENGERLGLVKLLDFGLVTRGGIDDNPGPVRGTLSYMSPEQAEGKPADARSDVFSFGCTFYEMLCGRKAFSKVTQVETLGRIRGGAPPDLGEVPRSCRVLLRRCLEPDPSRRIQTARELVLALRILDDRLRGRRMLRVIAFASAPVAIAAIAFLLPRPGSRSAGPDIWIQLTNLPDSVSQPALSPDGRLVAFIRGPNTFAGTGQIYVKSLPDGDARELTHDSLQKMSPAFSPDGSQIAYTVVARENRWDTWIVPAAGGQPHPWLSNASGMSWLGPRLLFSEIKDHDIHMGVVTANADGGALRDIYVPENERAMAHRSYPSPDGRWALIVEMDVGGVWLPCRLVPIDGSSSGHPAGPPGAGCTFAAWSPDGAWMYFSAAVGGVFHTWRQRFPNGRPEQVTSGLTEEEGIALTRDGSSFLTAVGLRQSAVWVHEASGERRISGEGFAYDPKFTPDGKDLCFRVRSGGHPEAETGELRCVEVGTGHNRAPLPNLAVTGHRGSAYDLSPDSRYLIAAVPDGKGKSHLWLAGLNGSSPARQIAGLEADQPLFVSNSEIMFRSLANGMPYLYQATLDGGNPRRLREEAIVQRGSRSPDRRWLSVRLMRPNGAITAALPLAGGPPVPVSAPGSLVYLNWAQDGKAVFLSVPGSMFLEQGRTYVVALPPGEMLPPIPVGGFESEAQIAALPGARRIEDFDVAPGLDPDTYAFDRVTLMRNLYRVPLR